MHYYYLRDAADMCGMKIRTAREWIKLGKLEAHKKRGSRMWLVSEDEINRVRGIINDNNKRKHSKGT